MSLKKLFLTIAYYIWKKVHMYLLEFILIKRKNIDIKYLEQYDKLELRKMRYTTLNNMQYASDSLK